MISAARCSSAIRCKHTPGIKLNGRQTDLSQLFVSQEEWAVHCSKMLAVNSSLMELHLGRMGMTNTGIEQLTEGLGRNHSLRYLDLCR